MKMMKMTWIAVLISMVCTSVFAEEDEWEFSLAPYMWASALEGTAATLPPAPPMALDVSFSDLAENIEMAFMLAGSARKGKWGITGDLMYSDIEAEGNTPGALFGDAKFKTEVITLTLLGTYRVVEEERFTVDLAAGARMWYADTELDLDAGINPARKFEVDEMWVDPVFGAMASAVLGRDFSVSLGGLIGGGGDADEDWSVLATLNYDVNETIRLFGGYRHMSVDYKKGDFQYDIEMSGPLFGAEFKF